MSHNPVTPLLQGTEPGQLPVNMYFVQHLPENWIGAVASVHKIISGNVIPIIALDQ